MTSSYMSATALRSMAVRLRELGEAECDVLVWHMPAGLGDESPDSPQYAGQYTAEAHNGSDYEQGCMQLLLHGCSQLSCLPKSLPVVLGFLVYTFAGLCMHLARSSVQQSSMMNWGGLQSLTALHPQGRTDTGGRCLPRRQLCLGREMV